MGQISRYHPGGATVASAGGYNTRVRRLVARSAWSMLAALVTVYIADFVVLRSRVSAGLPQVTVQTVYAVRQKDGRIEYSDGDNETETCSRSLFPQMGYLPCWYVYRHLTKVVKVGRTEYDPSGTIPIYGSAPTNRHNASNPADFRCLPECYEGSLQAICAISGSAIG